MCKHCTTVSIGLSFFKFFLFFSSFSSFLITILYIVNPWVGFLSVLHLGKWNGNLEWRIKSDFTVTVFKMSLGGTTSVREECHPGLWTPPSHRVPSAHRLTPLELSCLLFSRRVVTALLPLLQVRGIGLAASSGHGVTPGSAPQLVRQVPEHLSWPLVLFRAFPTMSTWSLE